MAVYDHSFCGVFVFWITINNNLFTFDQVLLVGDKDVKVGTPTVDGASVKATVVAEGKSKKVIVYRYKRKTGYHKKNGHRQPFTQVKIEKINA